MTDPLPARDTLPVRTPYATFTGTHATDRTPDDGRALNPTEGWPNAHLAANDAFGAPTEDQK